LNKLLPLVGVQFLAAMLVLLNAIVPGAPLTSSFYFNPPYVYAALNTIFLVPAGLAIAYLSAKTFRFGGPVGIHLMGAGALALCLATLSTWAGVTSQDINFYFVFLDLFGLFFGGGLQAAGAIVSYFGVTVEPEKREHATIAIYLTVLVFALATIAADVLGWIPPFFATSPTLVSKEVIGVAAVFFAVSTILLARTYIVTNSEVIYWYMMAMLLILMSVITYQFIRHPGDPISWLYRCISFLYGGAFLTAVVKSMAKPKTEESE
jgi:hypothetical protein